MKLWLILAFLVLFFEGGRAAPLGPKNKLACILENLRGGGQDYEIKQRKLAENLSQRLVDDFSRDTKQLNSLREEYAQIIKNAGGELGAEQEKRMISIFTESDKILNRLILKLVGLLEELRLNYDLGQRNGAYFIELKQQQDSLENLPALMEIFRLKKELGVEHIQIAPGELFKSRSGASFRSGDKTLKISIKDYLDMLRFQEIPPKVMHEFEHAALEARPEEFAEFLVEYYDLAKKARLASRGSIYGNFFAGDEFLTFSNELKRVAEKSNRYGLKELRSRSEKTTRVFRDGVDQVEKMQQKLQSMDFSAIDYRFLGEDNARYSVRLDFPEQFRIEFKLRSFETRELMSLQSEAQKKRFFLGSGEGVTRADWNIYRTNGELSTEKKLVFSRLEAQWESMVEEKQKRLIVESLRDRQAKVVEFANQQLSLSIQLAEELGQERPNLERVASIAEMLGREVIEGQ